MQNKTSTRRMNTFRTNTEKGAAAPVVMTQR